MNSTRLLPILALLLLLAAGCAVESDYRLPTFAPPGNWSETHEGSLLAESQPKPHQTRQ